MDMYDFEFVVNGRDVIVKTDGGLEALDIRVVDAKTGEEIQLSKEDRSRVWAEAYERVFETICARCAE